MAIAVKCPRCAATFSVDERLSGQVGTCPSCRHKLVVPQSEVSTSVPSPVVAEQAPGIAVSPSAKPHARAPRVSGALRTLLMVIGGLAIPLGLGVAYWKFAEFQETRRAAEEGDRLLDSLKDNPLFEGGRVVYSLDKDPRYHEEIRKWIIGGFAVAACGAACLGVAYVTRPKRSRRSLRSVSNDASVFLRRLGE